MSDSRFKNGGKPGPGRPKGLQNKATQEARKAIGMFVDKNSHRLQEWLDQVAQGVTDGDGNYVVPPNPEKAFNMFQSVVEYHVPKLARTELAGDPDNPIGITEVVRRVVRASD